MFRYNIVFFTLTYLVPMLGMMLCYLQVGQHLWRGDKTILRLVMIPPAAMVKRRTDKRRVWLSHVLNTNYEIIVQIVAMFGVVVCIFMVCWAPYHLYFILVFQYPSLTKEPYIAHIYLFFFWLAMANSCVNPIIYYWMNTRFRAYFNQAFCCLPSLLKMVTSISVTKAVPNTGFPHCHSCPAQLDRKYKHPTIPTILKRDNSTNTDNTSLLSLAITTTTIKEVLIWALLPQNRKRVKRPT